MYVAFPRIFADKDIYIYIKYLHLGYMNKA